MNARSDFPPDWPAIPRHLASVTLAPPPALPVHDARRLTGPGGVARIMLDGQTYSLRITRAGKLILTK